MPRAPSDLQWHGPVTLQLVALGLVGGVLSGWLGLGGGAIFNPIMLNLGIAPQVSSSTGMFMVLFTTFSSFLQFFIAGIFEPSYAGVLGACVVVFTFMGITQVNKIVKRSGRASIVVFCLASITSLSAVIIPIYGFMQESTKIESGIPIWSFNSYC